MSACISVCLAPSQPSGASCPRTLDNWPALCSSALLGPHPQLCLWCLCGQPPAAHAGRDASSHLAHPSGADGTAEGHPGPGGRVCTEVPHGIPLPSGHLLNQLPDGRADRTCGEGPHPRRAVGSGCSHTVTSDTAHALAATSTPSGAARETRPTLCCQASLMGKARASPCCRDTSHLTSNLRFSRVTQETGRRGTELGATPRPSPMRAQPFPGLSLGKRSAFF